MKLDFTMKMYETLLKFLRKNRYTFVTVEEFLRGKYHNRTIIMRHDVDRKVLNALLMAKLEKRNGVKSTYYFRTSTFKPKVVRFLSKLGHEIGYHYETLDKAHGDMDKAYQIFKKELQHFRKFVKISTICSHGNPLTPFVNLWLWKKFDYKKLGVLGEAYIDVFNKGDVEYFSDTNRRWKKVLSTRNLMRYIQLMKPKLVYLLVHPDKWATAFFDWTYSYVTHLPKAFLKSAIKTL